MANILEITGLCVETEDEEILHNIDLRLPKGEVHALLGPNGGGKTSLMMTIMGFSKYRITQGKVSFNGTDITNLDITARARMGVSIAQQRPPTISGVKLAQVLDYAVAEQPHKSEEIEKLAETVKMKAFMQRDINAGLSGGEIRRSELLQLLASRPKFAMMDEPDSGVDIEAMGLIGEMVNELFTRDTRYPAKRRSGLIITHTGRMLDFVDADKAHIVMGGRMVCSGNPRIIFDMIREYGYENCNECITREGVSFQ